MPEGEHSVSVVIPILGRNSLLNALESVARQTLKPTLIFVIDDSQGQEVNLGPSDIVTSLIRAGGSKGQSFARNLGMKRIQSSFIAFLNDDDVWLTHHLEYSINQNSIHSLDGIHTLPLSMVAEVSLSQYRE